MQLFMLKIGARPKGRLIEQHDVMFVLANSLSDVIHTVNDAWAEVKNKWHLDAWRVVNRVGDYQISVLQNLKENSLSKEKPFNDLTANDELKLYFVNLGGYLPNQFEEFHYKTLVVADSISKATAQVKKSDFYHDYTFNNANPTVSGMATSHVDDKHELDVDDIYPVADLLPDSVSLSIRALSDDEKATIPHDALHIGYLSLKQLKALP